MNRHSTTKRPKGLMVAAMAAAGVTAAALPARGNSRYWVGGSQGWNNPNAWSATLGGAGGAGVPAAGDSVFILASDATDRIVLLNVSTSPLILDIGNTGSGTLTLTQTSAFNITTTAYESLGHGVGAHALHIQSAGTNTYSTDLDLAEDAGSVGTYSLSGTGVVTLPTASGMYVGDTGTGLFNQSGGTVLVGASAFLTPLYLGYLAGSSGTYSLSGTGSVTVTGSEYVGYNAAATGTANGVFAADAGTHTVGQVGNIDFLYIGYRNGSSGTYSLSGTGVLTVNGVENIGTNATGSGNVTGLFVQSGGIHTTTAQLYISDLPGSSGTYSLSGSGSLAVNSDEFVGTGGGHGTQGNRICAFLRNSRFLRLRD